ncbi:MAG: M10 family metallopeptidase C-terminal domain-containing protein, partial [Rhodovulum sp.]
WEDGTDLIDLSAVDANANTVGDDAFVFIGTAAFSGTEGELRVEERFNSRWVLGDVDGDGIADLDVRMTGTATLDASDFLL